MKHLFTLKSLLLTLVMLCGLNAWGETPVYSLTFKKDTGNNAYANAHNTTSNGVDWSVYGNQAQGDFLGVGGKSITKVDRTLTSQTAVSTVAISKITLNHNGISNSGITINSIKVEGSTVSDFTSDVKTATITSPSFSVSKSGSLNFALESDEWAANSYFRITVNCTNKSTKKNYRFDISSVDFYGVSAAVTVDIPKINETSTANYGTAYFTNSTATAKITCATTDATIKYAITDGTEPADREWSDYTVGDEIKIISAEPATKTLWAKADKDGKSAVASKEFTFITEPKRIYFELVVDESQIVEGAKYVIADSKGAAIMGTTFDSSKGYYNAIKSGFNLSGNMLSIYETEKFASIEFEPVPKPSGDKTWFVKYNNGDGTYTYLKGKGNDLASSASAEDAASISIEADNSAIISFASNNEDYYIRYNVSFPRFKTYQKTTGNFVYLYRVYEEPAAATSTGLDEVLVGDAGKKYKISCQLRVNYKDANYVYASTTKGGFTKTAPTEAQKKEWWSDKEDKFNQNDWVAIQGLVDVEVGTEIAGGSTVVLCKNAAFPVVKFVSEVTPTPVGAIDANTFRVANFNIGDKSPLVNKLWLVEPQPAEYCKVKAYVDVNLIVGANALFAQSSDSKTEIKVDGVVTGYADPLDMVVNLADAKTKIKTNGWYLFEGIVVNGSTGLELNAISATVGSIETGVEGVETSSVKVYGAEGVINVESEEVAPIAVYSANGAIVSSVEASSASIAVAPGFYIVKAGNSVSKVTVK